MAEISTIINNFKCSNGTVKTTTEIKKKKKNQKTTITALETTTIRIITIFSYILAYNAYKHKCKHLPNINTNTT